MGILPFCQIRIYYLIITAKCDPILANRIDISHIDINAKPIVRKQYTFTHSTTK